MKVFKWILFIVFILWGTLNILSFSTHMLYIATAFILFTLAVLVCPLLDEKFKKFKYKSLVIAVLIVLAFALYYIIGTAIMK